MQLLAKVLGAAALAGLVAASLGYLGSAVSLEMCKHVLLAATLVWFVAAYVASLVAGKPAGSADGSA